MRTYGDRNESLQCNINGFWRERRKGEGERDTAGILSEGKRERDLVCRWKDWLSIGAWILDDNTW